jgi:uncharacterized protein (TIGR02453 family)
METIKKSTLDFLELIKLNNNREWFLDNKAIYLEARENFETFAGSILSKITEFEPILKGLEIKNCVYRFNRDTRFSSDKSPYKSHFGAFIVRGGKSNGDKLAGYYLHVEPGKSIVAGGAYMPPKQWLEAIREKIDDEPATLKKILKEKEFVKYFKELDGEKLKKAPKGYPADHPEIELLKFKSFLAFSDINDDLVVSDKFFDYVVNAFRAMKPLNDYLNDY